MIPKVFLLILSLPCIATCLLVKGGGHAGANVTSDYAAFVKEFERRVHASRKKVKERRFIIGEMMDRHEVPQDGLWLKFGVDVACDTGRCDKITILSDYRRDHHNIYGFDWFKGLPETWRKGFEKGHFGGRKIPAAPKGVQFVTGLYQDSLPKFLMEHTEKVTYLLIDCDLYSSTKFVLDAVKPRLAPNAVLYFDEMMNYVGYQDGELKAFYEFLAENNLDYDIIIAAAEMEPEPAADGDAYAQQIALSIKPLK
eukprot:TRINITY_DN4265_c0_g1_i1.p1 TRINITY_DN4265_c0_g1~~TRINITY_DN4265_c0_g1_i1.p1  ORF type:complete len:280 (+),score=47.09 TRINITY_DN4265_c0_g1_i1:79-840(+)